MVFSRHLFCHEHRLTTEAVLTLFFPPRRPPSLSANLRQYHDTLLNFSVSFISSRFPPSAGDVDTDDALFLTIQLQEASRLYGVENVRTAYYSRFAVVPDVSTSLAV